MSSHKPWRADYAHHQRARQLRQENTPAERLLWEQLRNRQLAGLKFRRQVPRGRYIMDFYCPEHKAAVELDGSVHAAQADYDQARDEVLKENGIRILHLSNILVIEKTQEALQKIERFCRETK
ncbi:MAG: endonuclease domain-containing protein [Anaerolineales bacterium]|nr:endonuclease domain-containing protein [Anaerolineales bacterium]